MCWRLSLRSLFASRLPYPNRAQRRYSAMAKGMETWDARAQTFSLGTDATYLVNFLKQGIPIDGPQEDSLVTVFHVPADEIRITQSWISARVQKYERDDDVFQQGFLTGVILTGSSESEIEVTSDAVAYLSSVGMQWMQCKSASKLGQNVLPGPYCLIDGHLRDVWRLFKDTHGTLMTTFLSGSFQEIPLNCVDDSFPRIAVSSRLKSGEQPRSPIDGWRVVVKDNFHIAGVPTSLCNRAYRNTFAPPKETAKCLQVLTNQHAVIVGKTKLNPFGVWVEPTEYVDYQAPWNPRADGYQSPGGSSTGSASAIAAYEWLDIAIGTDTAGSIMRPGLWCGCFALRPSFAPLSSEGLVVSIDYLDVPSFLGRDLRKCRDFAAAWYGNKLPSTEPKPFTSIIWVSDFWDVIESQQCELALEFVNDLEASLGLKHTKVSFDEEWLRSPPKKAGSDSLMGYMVPATTGIWYDFYHAFDEFRDKHWKKFGSAPYVSPPVRKNWDLQSTITKSERDESVDRLAVYREWFKTQFASGQDDHPLFVLPIENLTPRYRDEPPNFEKPLSGINSLFLSPVMEAPELIVPVGQIEYKSKVSHNIEQLPFALGLMALPGSDLMLMDTIHKVLSDAGRPTVVQTGKLMFKSETET